MKKYPVLYAQSLQGTLYKHCQTVYAVYLSEPYNPDFTEDNDSVKTSYLTTVRNEIYYGLDKKLVNSQPLLVKNDKKQLIIFKSNLDPQQIKAYIQMALDELAYWTNYEFLIDYFCIEAKIMELKRPAGMFSIHTIGDKLTSSAVFEESLKTIGSNGFKNDNGYLTPFEDYQNDQRSFLDKVTSNEE